MFVQLLDERGERVESAEFDPYVADLGPDELLGFYRDMVVVRRLDTEATALQRQGELALWPPLLGQEAAQIGSGRTLRPGDFVFSSYREHAVGYAMGIRNDATDDVAVAYFGDGALSEGDVAEALVFAASFAAPVVFFCQNNQWAISEPVRVQSTVDLADRAGGFGIPALRVDGNDVLAVAAATRVALERARSGGGPTFIEAVTYRMGPHTTADDPTRYRDAGELTAWGERDPISRLAALLRALGALDAEGEARVVAAAEAAAAELRAGCLALADPQPLEIFDHVYAEPHPVIERQRADYARYLDGFAD